jgi:single-strand DNA-binding protein
MINNVTFSGRLGADPELRQTNSGDAVTTLNVAVDAGKDQTVWMRTSVWGKTAELCGQYLKKGSYVVINGRLTDDSYTNKDGVKVNKIGVKAFAVDFGPRQPEDNTAAAPRPVISATVQDDLPF